MTLIQFLLALCPMAAYREYIRTGRQAPRPTGLIDGPYRGGFLIPADFYRHEDMGACLTPSREKNLFEHGLWDTFCPLSNTFICERRFDKLGLMFWSLVSDLTEKAGTDTVRMYPLEIASSCEASYCDHNGHLLSSFQTNATLFRLTVAATEDRPNHTKGEMIPAIHI